MQLLSFLSNFFMHLIHVIGSISPSLPHTCFFLSFDPCPFTLLLESIGHQNHIRPHKNKLGRTQKEKEKETQKKPTKTRTRAPTKERVMQLEVNRQTKSKDKKKRASPGFLVSGRIVSLLILTLRPMCLRSTKEAVLSHMIGGGVRAWMLLPTLPRPPILNPWGSGPGLQEKVTALRPRRCGGSSKEVTTTRPAIIHTRLLASFSHA